MSLSGLSCVDIDDCRENPLICLHGRCRNTVGSYICECESGYLHSSDGGKYSLYLAEIKNYWLFPFLLFIESRSALCDMTRKIAR